MTRSQLRTKDIIIMVMLFINILFVANTLIRLIFSLVLIAAMLTTDIIYNEYLSMRQLKIYKILLAIFSLFYIASIGLTLMGSSMPTLFNFLMIAIVLGSVLMLRQQR